MKTNTLLAAAAILAVGGLAAQAQVYSQNVVGYYNITVPSHGYALVANQLLNGSDAAQTNSSVSTVFSGLSSDVNGATNTIVYLWNGAGYAAYQYFNGSDADNYFLIGPGSSNGFYDAGGNLITTALPQSAGAFLYNPNAAITATVVGTVPQTTNLIALVSGFNLVALPIPVSTNLESSIGGFAGTSDVNGLNNDVLFKWTGAGYAAYQYFNGSDADNYFLIGPGSPNGFYDAGGNVISSASPVGQGFFIQHIAAGTEYWTNTFSVQ